jgi:putative nucleotidyltransferase with HDIG domain
MKTVDKILKSIQNIPAFPVTSQRVTDIMKNPDYSISQVVNVIKYDPSITANILKICNSAYFGVRRISTLHDAVVFLGQNNIIRAIQVSGISRFFNKNASGYGLNAQELWKHSVGVALMTQILSKKISGREDNTLFTAGLLHDIGKFILSEFVQDSYSKIMDLVTKQGFDFLRAEEEVIGVSHSEVGGRIAQHWNFPQDIHDAIKFHHRPDLMEHGQSKLCWIIYLADQVCLIMGIGGGTDGLAYWGLKEVIDTLKIRHKDLESGMMELLVDLENAQELISIV